jgi:hypothetical protein
MRCPHCHHEGVPSISGPYDTSDRVPPVAYFVCRDCDRFLGGAFMQPPPMKPKGEDVGEFPPTD